MKKIFIISLVVLIIDIISKRLVMNYMFSDMSISVIDNFFSLTYAKNEGIAFSLFDGYVDLIVVGTLVVICLIIKYVRDNVTKASEMVGYSFIIGGAFGNLLDRVMYGYVVDFLDFKIFGYNYPIFNLADTFIVIGVFILIILSFREVGDSNGNSGK